MSINREYFEQRTKERSTWLGVVGFLGAVGFTVSPEMTESIIGIGTALSGLIFSFTPDKS